MLPFIEQEGELRDRVDEVVGGSSATESLIGRTGDDESSPVYSE